MEEQLKESLDKQREQLQVSRIPNQKKRASCMIINTV